MKVLAYSCVLAGYDSHTFTWDKYLKETNAKSAPAQLFNTVRQEVQTFLFLTVVLCDYSHSLLVLVTTCCLQLEILPLMFYIWHKINVINEELLFLSSGLPRSWLLPQHEAGGGGLDGAAPCMRGHCEAMCGPPAPHPF